MRIIAAVRDTLLIKKILRHLGLWSVPARAPPRRPSRDDDFDDVARDGGPATHPSTPMDLWLDHEYANDITQDEPVDPWLNTWPGADPVSDN